MKLQAFLRSSAAACFLLGWTAPAIGDVLYVDATGNGQFTDIQSAINAALDGDVLLVRSGSYAAFTVDARSLSILADAGAHPVITGKVVITNTVPGAAVLVAGLKINGAPGSYSPTACALGLSANLGHVRIQDCIVRGADGLMHFPAGDAGQIGASVTGSARVAFKSCTLRGGDGYGNPVYGPDGGPGGVGLLTQGSAVALYDCAITGGAGGDADYALNYLQSGEGGHGCVVSDYGILASGCSFNGGPGGGTSMNPGRGGDGLVVQLGAQAQLVDNTYVAGQGGYGYSGPGQNGSPQSGGGVFNLIAGARRTATAQALAAESSSFPIALGGEPGDQIWLMRSNVPGFIYVPSYAGILLVPLTLFVSARPVVVLPASGTANVALDLLDVGTGLPALRQFWQVVAVSSTGAVRIGSPLHVVVLNCSDLSPDCNGNSSCDSCDLLRATSVDCDVNGEPDECQADCNGNGIADPCDLASGASVDLNHNGIPDECEPQTTWYVDASSPGGNGSAGAPFPALGQAFAAAISGDTVIVANGTYVGPSNRNLDFGNRNLIVQSVGGAASCIIDCQLQGRAFLVQSGLTSATRIEGFTIQNGKVTGSSPISRGGGIYVKNSSPQVRACIFTGCEASSSGGAMETEQSGALIVGCVFDSNHSLGGAGGGALHVGGGTLTRVLDSDFVGNLARDGGAVTLQGNATFERCRCLGNTATEKGGALYAESAIVLLDQGCLAGNSAKSGGAISLYRGGWTISNCTIVDNTATVAAGAVYFAPAAPYVGNHTWRNDIFRNNTSPTGFPIDLRSAVLDVAYCDLQGGQGSIALYSGTLNWGAGNLDLDPLFVDPDGPDNNPSTTLDNDYRLSLASPCVDSASNPSVAPDAFDLDGDGNLSEPVPFDFDGHPRFSEVPSAPNTGVGPPPIVDMGPWERLP
jgi:predicted outer membrane repeat protein